MLCVLIHEVPVACCLIVDASNYGNVRYGNLQTLQHSYDTESLEWRCVYVALNFVTSPKSTLLIT